MNSIVGPIFNKKNCWKVEYVGSWTVHLCTVHSWIGHIMRLPKKKKKQKTQTLENSQPKRALKHTAQANSIYNFLYYYIFPHPPYFTFFLFLICSLLFSLIHTRLLYLTFTLPTFEFYPIFYEIYTLKLTHYLTFSWLSSFFLFFNSHTQLISVFLSSLFSLLYSPLSLSLSLSDGYPDMLSMIAFNMDAQLFCLCSQNAGKHQWKHIIP